jgi:hypothetical protein
VSCDALRAWIRDGLYGRLEHVREALERVSDPGLQEVLSTTTRGGKLTTYRRGERDERGYDNFSIVVSNRKRDYAAEIKQLEGEIARQEKRLVGWSPR